VSVSTATSLPSAQWRLINEIGQASPGGVPPGGALRVAVADRDDLVALMRAGLVSVELAGARLAPERVEWGLELDTSTVRTQTTDAGASWVKENPANSVLVYLAGLPRGQASVATLKANTTCENGADLNALRDAGLIEIRDEGGRQPSRARVCVGYSDRWLVCITHPGRRLVGRF
jgi:hypothetical protein